MKQNKNADKQMNVYTLNVHSPDPYLDTAVQLLIEANLVLVNHVGNSMYLDLEIVEMIC